MDELHLQDVEEILHWRVVIAAAFAAHRAPGADHGQLLPIDLGDMLAAPIRVYMRPRQGPRRRTAINSADNGSSVRMCARASPTSDLARRKIKDGGQTQSALTRGSVGDTSKPDAVRLCRLEVPRQQVGRDRQYMAAVGGSRAEPPTRYGPNAMRAHQSHDAIGTAPRSARLNLLTISSPSLGSRGALHPCNAKSAPLRNINRKSADHGSGTNDIQPLARPRTTIKPKSNVF